MPARHDDTPQTLLGVDGVHDADTTIAAATSSPACPVFLASKLGRYLLGDIDDATVLALAATFANADLDISALARATLDAGVGGAATPTVLRRSRGCSRRSRQPVPASTAELADPLRSMGQLPATRRTSGAIPARRRGWRRRPLRPAFGGNHVARATPDEAPALAAAQAGDWSGLADLFMRPAGFSDATITALEDLKPSVSARPGEGALALALASPDLLIA